MTGQRVLVIEDDRDVRVLLDSHLRRLGCEVLLASTGEEGLRIAQKVLPDVVLVDMVLPGIDGSAVIRALRSEPSTRRCYIVVTTVLDEADVADAGANATLPKPFIRADVARVLPAAGAAA